MCEYTGQGGGVPPEEVIDRLRTANSVYVLINNGRSMQPFLRRGDLLEVKRPELVYPDGIARNGDIVLYQSSGELTAHRVISVSRGMYHIAGDNNIWKEIIPFEEVYAVMTGIWRKNRYISHKSLYCRKWAICYGYSFTFCLRRMVRRIRKNTDSESGGSYMAGSPGADEKR